MNELHDPQIYEHQRAWVTANAKRYVRLSWARRTEIPAAVAFERADKEFRAFKRLFWDLRDCR